MNYTLGSHNSFTYLPVTKWWMKPIRFTAKCQEVSIKELYELGSRCFDLRVRFNDKGLLIMAHGIIEFEAKSLTLLLYYLSDKDVYVRVLLEFNKEPKDLDFLVELFQIFCKGLQEVFPTIKFFGGRGKWNWEVYYQFNANEPSLDDKYSSTDSIKYINDIFPKAYAKLYNKGNLAKGTDKDFLFIDYVNIQ